MTTAYIDPDGDVATPWGVTATPHWSKIDDGVRQPTAGDGTYIEAGENDDSEIEIFTMTSSPADTGTVTGIEVWGYITCFSKADDDDELDIAYRIGSGGSWSSWQTIIVTTAILWNWDSVSWTSLSLSKSDIDDIQIGVRSSDMGKLNWIRLDALYAEITYTEVTGNPWYYYAQQH